MNETSAFYMRAFIELPNKKYMVKIFSFMSFYDKCINEYFKSFETKCASPMSAHSRLIENQ